jgi:hypothetical protein
MARIQWNIEEYEQMFHKAGMDRVQDCAVYLDHKLKTNVIRSYKNRRPVYKTGKDAGKLWTARDMDIMAKTVRVVTRPGKLNVWVMIGTFKTWWALQMERGRGDWKGGPIPFIRKSIAESRDGIRAICEGPLRIGVGRPTEGGSE